MPFRSIPRRRPSCIAAVGSNRGARANRLAAAGFAIAAGLAASAAWGQSPSQAESGGTPVVAATPAATQPAATASVFSGDQKKAIETIIKDYLVANPELFLEIQGALEQKMEKIQSEKLKVALTENAGEIFRRPDAPFTGNPKGDVTVVEFFDYNCGYCKRGLSEIIKLLDKDPKVKVVFKELPILSKGSEEAARVALAARIQGKYWEVHRGLLEAKGQLNEATSLKVAEKVSLDIAKLKKDMNGPEVTAEIEKVRALAQKMGINGTPHFLVGDKSIPGAPDDLYEQIAKLAGDIRKNGCSVC
ncbi:MAG: disulfide bond formation protein DsbA [Hyphomicrobium sp.]|nr:disulfide bond formation protein DsbA [Hyphomicrobium sp.]PPC80454.1 MAG: disulfide bond formation protein DsbA [Hyphomicrobium sp.]